MGEERYQHSDEKDAVELERLAIQADTYDPATIRHLKTIGISGGWKCLEVGAGAGSIAQWLSQRVGPSGKVVATDIDSRFLSRISAPNLETRRHDILRDDVEKGWYDIAHCRMVLHHLPEPEKALKRMADALRPGGWLLIEEDDYGSVLSLDITDPSAASFVATARTLYDFLGKRGIVDQYWGRRVRSLVEGLGFSDCGQEGWTLMVRGGDPLARVYEATGQVAYRPAVAAGVVTQEQVDSAQRRSMDPTFYYLGHTIFSAWGRKPIQGGGT